MSNFPAFPVRIENNSKEDMKGFNSETIQPNTFLQYYGVSQRDYFATKAMAAIISTVPHLSTVDPQDVAVEAYSYADAMLAERAK